MLHGNWNRRVPLILTLAAALLAVPVSACVGQEAVPGPDESASEGTNAARHLDAPYVIMVSFDGFRHDYFGRVPTPNFERVMRAGVRAEGLVPVFPTVTFPNHYSIATGMWPENHGLVGNTMYDPVFDDWYHIYERSDVEDPRWYGGEPIWMTAEKQGMVAASFFWVGSEARTQRPTYWRRYDGSVPRSVRVDQVLEWLQLPPKRRPHLIMLYFSAVDHAGHEHGPASAAVDRAIREVDEALGRLLDGIEELPIADEVYVILVSDHGMAATDPDRRIFLDEYIDMDGIRMVGSGPFTQLWFKGDEDRRERVYRTLRRELEHARVWLKEDIPERLHYDDHRRIGDLLVLADVGWMVGTRESLETVPPGMHGWAPRNPSMHGIFLAMGPRIREGERIPAFRNIHIYPLVAHLLGLEPNPAADGRLEVLRPILR